MIPEVAVAFVADLLHLPAGTPEHTVGHWMWGHMGDDDRDGVLTAVLDVMLNWPAVSDRHHELAVEIWWLLGGRGAAA